MKKNTLLDLVNLSKNFNEIKKSLSELNWDEEEEVVLYKSNVISILNRYMNGEINIEILEDWANAIEGREDIEYEEAYFDTIKQLIFEVANPTLEGQFDKVKAKQWMDRLN